MNKIFKTWTGAIVLIIAIASVALLNIKNHMGPKYKIRWVLAHEPISVFQRAASLFRDDVARISNGEVEVEILTIPEYAAKYNSGVQFTPSEVFNQLRAGNFEMSQTYTTVLGAQSPKMWVLDLPFLFRDHEHAAKVLEGPIGQQLLASLTPKNVRGLTFTYSGGFRVIPTVDRPLTRIEDFKGLIINTTVSPVAEATFKVLGATPINLMTSESAVALEKGRVDGVETTYVRYTPVQQKAAPILNETHHSLFLTGVIINENFYQQLPEKYQSAIREAAVRAGRQERVDSINDGLKVREDLAAEGIRLVSMSSTEMDRMKAATLPVYNQFSDMFGKDLIASIQNTH